MADENELIKLREELNQIQDNTRKSRKVAAFGFGILIIALIFSIVYAFVQQVAATKNAEEAYRQKELAEEHRVMAEKNAAEAAKQAAIASAARAAAVEEYRRVQEELEKCKRKK